MIDLLGPPLRNGYARVPSIGLLAAIRGKNIENFRHLLRVSRNEFLETDYPLILSEVLKSKLEEFRLGCEINVDADYEAWKQHAESRRKKSQVPYGQRFIRHALLETARGDPDNEAFILLLWERINLTKALSKAYLGDALLSVAGTCCSVKLAKYLIDAGAPIDHRRRDKYFTPLHRAATQNNSEAAELVRFLLGLGADPAAFATSIPGHGSKVRRIRDEAGAKGISKWLGMSWDDLVEKTKAERQN